MEETKKMSFRPKNDNFVPDLRSTGWWTTNIVEYFGVNVRDFVSCKKSEIEAAVKKNIQDLLDVYCRYRIYAHDSGVLIMSVREEDVNHVCDALHNFRLQRPKSFHFDCVKIGTENAPYYRDLVPEFQELIHNYDIKTILTSDDTHFQEVIRRNYVLDMVNTLTKRIVIDYKEGEMRDHFIKAVCTQAIVKACKCKTACTWRSFKNVWDFQEVLESLGTRGSGERKRIFGKFYTMTKKQFEAKLQTHLKRFLIELNEEVLPAKSGQAACEAQPEILTDFTDNQPLRDVDVHHGRGLYLSQSTTYPNWTRDSPAADDETDGNTQPRALHENAVERVSNLVRHCVQVQPTTLAMIQKQFQMFLDEQKEKKTKKKKKKNSGRKH